MICLVALTGTAPSGCLQPSTVPPAASIHRSPGLTTPSPSRQVRPELAKPEREKRPQPQSSVLAWQVSNPRDWKYIVIHHTASESGSVESIDETHSQRKDGAGNRWLGIGYHFVIGNGQGMRDGEVEPTFRWKQQLHGAHAGDNEYNQRGIGIVLVGNFEEHPPSSAQLSAVKSLVASLRSEYGIRPANVIGHADVKATKCPGRYFPLDEVASARLLHHQFSSHQHPPTPTQWAGFHGSRL